MDLQAVKARVSWTGGDEKGEHSHKSPRNEAPSVGVLSVWNRPHRNKVPAGIEIHTYRMPSFCVQHCRVWLVGTCN